MQIIRNHTLNEDFIDKMDAEEVVQNNTVNASESEFKFSYILHYRIQRVLFCENDTVDILYKAFVRFVTMLPLLRHVESCGTPKVIIKDDFIGKDNFEYIGKDMRLDVQSFRVIMEDYTRSLIEQKTEGLRGTMDVDIEIPFKEIRVPYKNYVCDINSIHGAVLYSLRHNVLHGDLDLGFWDSYDQPIFIASTWLITSQIEIQSAYLLIFNSKEELIAPEFNQIVYRSQRMPIVTRLCYIEEHPDCFKGYKTEVVGMIDRPDSVFSEESVVIRIFPQKDFYCDNNRMFVVGETIINGLKASDIYNLRPYSEKSKDSLFTVWIIVPGDCYDSIRLKKTTKEFDIRERIKGRVVLVNENFEDAGFNTDNIQNTLENLRNRFENIYQKEKQAQSKANQR